MQIVALPMHAAGDKKPMRTRPGSLADKMFSAIAALNVGESAELAGDWSKGAVRVSLHFLGKRSGKRFGVNQRTPGVHVITRKG